MINMAKSHDLIIVGAGVVGLCTAYFAQKAGIKTLLIDEREETSDRCSTGNAGFIVPSHFIPLCSPATLKLGLKMAVTPGSPLALPTRPDKESVQWMLAFRKHATKDHVAKHSPLLLELNLASRELYKQMDQEGEGAFSFQESGVMLLCRTQKGFKEESELASEARVRGLQVDTLNAAQTKTLEPQISAAVQGAIHYQDDATLDPPALLTWLRSTLRSMGCGFAYGQQVTEIQSDGQAVMIKTKSNTYIAQNLVLAGGASTGQLAKMVGLNLPMLGGKGYSVTIDAPPSSPTQSAILMEDRVAVARPGGKLRITGTMEIGGEEGKINQKRLDGIFVSLKNFYQDSESWPVRSAKVWSGLRPCSPDGLPYLGRCEKHENILIASGHAMMGVSLAPISGQLITELLQGRNPEILTAFSPDRFS